MNDLEKGKIQAVRPLPGKNDCSTRYFFIFKFLRSIFNNADTKTSCEKLTLQISTKDKTEVFQKVVLVSGMNPLSGQYNDKTHQGGIDSGEEICCA